MGDLQDPIYGGKLVPYFWPYELGGYSLKFRPEQWAFFLMVGTSNKSVPEMAIDHMCHGQKMVPSGYLT
jgi:hypothetical protein